MDPDAARSAIIEKANVIRGLVNAASTPPTFEELVGIAVAGEDLAEVVHDLDEWLRAGGFFPKAWTGPNPRRAQDGRKQDVLT